MPSAASDGSSSDGLSSIVGGGKARCAGEVVVIGSTGRGTARPTSAALAVETTNRRLIESEIVGARRVASHLRLARFAQESKQPAQPCRKSHRRSPSTASPRTSPRGARRSTRPRTPRRRPPADRRSRTTRGVGVVPRRGRAAERTAAAVAAAAGEPGRELRRARRARLPRARRRSRRGAILALGGGVARGGAAAGARELAEFVRRRGRSGGRGCARWRRRRSRRAPRPRCRRRGAAAPPRAGRRRPASGARHAGRERRTGGERRAAARSPLPPPPAGLPGLPDPSKLLAMMQQAKAEAPTGG